MAADIRGECRRRRGLLLRAAGDVVRGQGWILGNNSGRPGHFTLHGGEEGGHGGNYTAANSQGSTSGRDGGTHPHKLYI